jgi:hypothetical protein
MGIADLIRPDQRELVDPNTIGSTVKPACSRTKAP